MQRISLDLGCGTCRVPGSFGLDNVRLENVDVVADISMEYLPFRDDCIDEVFLHHVIEHFPFERYSLILAEVWRILKPGGTLSVRVPHVYSVAAWGDPTHRSGFTFGTLGFFDTGHNKSYYREIQHHWHLLSTKADATLFNWKMYRLRKLDGFISRIFARILNRLLHAFDFPGSADIAVKMTPAFFVEIQHLFEKSKQD